MAIQWHLASDPPEPFLTKLRLVSGSSELYREEHVAYPAGTWQPGDWRATRFLNLFNLPSGLSLPPDTVITISHQGILTGKTTTSSAQIRLRP